MLCAVSLSGSVREKICKVPGKKCALSFQLSTLLFIREGIQRQVLLLPASVRSKYYCDVVCCSSPFLHIHLHLHVFGPATPCARHVGTSVERSCVIIFSCTEYWWKNPMITVLLYIQPTRLEL